MHNGMAVATQFDASLAAQRAAWKSNDRSALTTEAQKELELVDTLENLD
jgi:hypothetical protein